MSDEIRKKHIVMVDDEPVNLELAENALKENYKLTKLISGAQLLTFLKRIRPDMILLDVQMPDMDGYQVMEQIMGDPKTKNIPVIFLTGQEGSESETKGFNLGAIDFIKKPFESNSMLARIRSQMKHFGHEEGDSQNFSSFFAETFPGFLSIRNSKHQIVYLNDNFRNWIKLYTDVEPIGKTNIEITRAVPKNVGDTFLQCHDASIALQSRCMTKKGLKKVIEFKDTNELLEDSQFFDVLKYMALIGDEPHIFTIAYDITELYKENQQNLD